MRIAAVIPTLDEEHALPAALSSTKSALDFAAGDFVVVCDGGSLDQTLRIAEDHGARVVKSAAGRGIQLHCGAEAAIAGKAEVLIFQHADTLLPPEARAAIVTALGTSIAGGFVLRFSHAPWLVTTLGAKLVNWRTRRFRVPLGDQAQFMLASTYQEVGGYPQWPLLEDVDMLRSLHRRCRRTGEQLAVITEPVTTSGRRFHSRGTLQTLITNWWLLARFALGASPAHLATSYRIVREGPVRSGQPPLRPSR